MSKITDYTCEVERDLLKARAILKGGLAESLEHLRLSAENVSEQVQADGIEKLKAAGEYCEEAIDAVESELGILSYLDAENDIDSLEDFDRLTEPLVEALRKARKRMEGAEIAGDILMRSRKVLNESWQDLRVTIEMVRVQLMLESDESSQTLAELRTELGAALQTAARRAEYDQTRAKGIVKTTFHEIDSLAKVAGRTLQVLFDGTVDQPPSPSRDASQY